MRSISSFIVVTDLVSVAMSYEADRQMLAGTLEGDATYFTLHKKHRGLLRFSISKERLTGMTALALQYPSLTLADEASPLKLWCEGAQDRRAAVRAKVVELLAGLPDGEGKPDERWFWAAPALLDGERGVGGEFLESWSLEGRLRRRTRWRRRGPVGTTRGLLSTWGCCGRCWLGRSGWGGSRTSWRRW